MEQSNRPLAVEEVTAQLLREQLIDGGPVEKQFIDSVVGTVLYAGKWEPNKTTYVQEQFVIIGSSTPGVYERERLDTFLSFANTDHGIDYEKLKGRVLLFRNPLAEPLSTSRALSAAKINSKKFPFRLNVTDFTEVWDVTAEPSALRAKAGARFAAGAATPAPETEEAAPTGNVVAFPGGDVPASTIPLNALAARHYARSLVEWCWQQVEEIAPMVVDEQAKATLAATMSRIASDRQNWQEVDAHASQPVTEVTQEIL